MVTRLQIVTTAAREIGYVEQGGRDGRSGNITKFWAARFPAWQGQPWCGAFVDWVLAQHGVDGYPIGRNGIFYTPSIVAAARSKGVWRPDTLTSLSKVKAGDIVLFDFNGSGNAQHVGFAEKYLGNGVVQTIEGNTSPTNVGSQNNGGGVYRRQRSGASIMGYVDMTAHLTGLATRPAVGVRLTTKQVQQLVGVTADGDYGPATTAAVAALQKHLGITSDGQYGPDTERTIMTLQDDIKALSTKIDTTTDWARKAVNAASWDGPARTTQRLTRVLASTKGIDHDALATAIADAIRDDVTAAVKGAKSGASASEIADEIAKRMASES